MLLLPPGLHGAADQVVPQKVGLHGVEGGEVLGRGGRGEVGILVSTASLATSSDPSILKAWSSSCGLPQHQRGPTDHQAREQEDDTEQDRDDGVVKGPRQQLGWTRSMASGATANARLRVMATILDPNMFLMALAPLVKKDSVLPSFLHLHPNVQGIVDVRAVAAPPAQQEVPVPVDCDEGILSHGLDAGQGPN